ncbi:PDZ domain-containing protein [Neisseriaceae bacterium ESL0693]|nr:PDZ domain-containing protein [Neisseriaceae bacterium ESL0693]
MLHYHIRPHSLHQHLWQVTLCFTQTDTQDFSLSLPNWVPGSYMIRDFARHIVSLQANCNGVAVTTSQINKNSWSLPGHKGHWRISYLVYAFDVSVRGAFLSNERGFFDGACIFLRHNQRQHEPCQLNLSHLPNDWDVATALPPTTEHRQYQSENYAELIDCPVMLGKLLRLPFKASGIEHEIVINGHFPAFDQARLLSDVEKICATEIALFQAPAPFSRYCFLLFVGQGVYGGLEHRSSSALMADRHDLPSFRQHNQEAYITLLGLFSHEYFHAWNVKSIKPAAFADSDLNQEAYTELLWAFEGITSYYDDWLLVRSQVITVEQYLALLAKTITRVQKGAGRQQQTLAESSFTAWTKYYKQNENSPNAIVSYYQKGALAALCLDQYIRRHSHQRYSLDDVMRALYQHWRQHQQPLAESAWLDIAQQATGLDLSTVYQQYIYTTQDLPLADALADLGVTLNWHACARQHGGAYAAQPLAHTDQATDLGARFTTGKMGIHLTQVFHDGSAEQAGLCAGDQLIAIDHEMITDFNQQWARLSLNQTIVIHYVRDGLLQHTQLTIQAAHADTALLSINDQHQVQNWLYGKK